MAKGAFWLHSPFLFRLYTEVIRHRSSDAGKKIEAFRRELSRSTKPVQVLDLGAGQGKRGGGTYHSTVGTLVSRVSRKPKVGELLHQLCQYFQPKQCLEFGTHVGISALYQLSALPAEARFVSMEGAPELAALAQEHLRSFDLDAELLVGDFDVSLQQINWEIFQPDYVFIDGNHQYEPTLRYVEYVLPKVQDGCLIVLDDIHWSPNMTRAWEAINQLPDISVSIDLYHVGLCFVRRPQAKEHFRLRF